MVVRGKCQQGNRRLVYHRYHATMWLYIEDTFRVAHHDQESMLMMWSMFTEMRQHNTAHNN